TAPGGCGSPSTPSLACWGRRCDWLPCSCALSYWRSSPGASSSSMTRTSHSYDALAPSVSGGSSAQLSSRTSATELQAEWSSCCGVRRESGSSPGPPRTGGRCAAASSPPPSAIPPRCCARPPGPRSTDTVGGSPASLDSAGGSPAATPPPAPVPVGRLLDLQDHLAQVAAGAQDLVRAGGVGQREIGSATC